MAGTVTVTASDSVLSLALKVYVLTGGVEPGGNQVSGVNSPPTGSLTPAGNSSLPVWGVYDETASNAFGAAASNTLDNGAASGGSTESGNGRYTGTVTSGTPITVGASTPTGDSTVIACYEILASGGTTPAVDGSTPAWVNSSPTAISTASFTPPVGSVLVAVTVMAKSTSADPVMSDSFGLGLVWTKRSGVADVPGSGSGAYVFTTSIAAPPTAGPAISGRDMGQRPVIVVSNAGWRGGQHSR